MKQEAIPFEDFIPDDARRGRGAATNRSSRFDETRYENVDTGWENGDGPSPHKTQYFPDATKTIITKNQSPDVPFERSINMYRGCEHGCIYCFARPTHSYLGHSAGLDFETKIHFKPDAVALLKKELMRRNYALKPIALGTNTDPYQPIEKDKALTRAILETLLEARHPVMITTKNALILRDMDILRTLARRKLVHVSISITTLDHRLSRLMEPRASSPANRIAALKALVAAKIPTSASLSPMIPKLNDHEMEALLFAAKGVGVTRASCLLIRLPLEVRELFEEWLALHFPDRKEKVMRYIRECYGGTEYISEFGIRGHGTGVYAELLANRFDAAVNRIGMNKDMTTLDCDAFSVPPAWRQDERKDDRQGWLFDM